MSSSDLERNLLFGILALQMDLISRVQLVEAMRLWLQDRREPVEQIMVRQGMLHEADPELLAPLVARHVDDHQGDPGKSLEALSSIGLISEDLRSLGNAQLDATLSVASETPRDWQVTQTRGEISNATPEREATMEGVRYAILRPHAKGGLGEVSVALDRELNREVALKLIRPQFAHDESSRSRFVLEAEVTGNLEHPGIVPVYGLGQYPDGRPFYAMRFIRGDSLKQAASRFHQSRQEPAAESSAGAPSGAMECGQGAEGNRDAGKVGRVFDGVEFRKLLGRFVDVCNAIAYAHSRGVLHRDLKPGNVMLGKYGETLVVDWGLAKVQGHTEETTCKEEPTLKPQSGSDVAQTAMGSVLGTPAYMPPEQAAGHLDEMGPASDVYSLGATLYYLLTGRAPIEGKTLDEILQKVRDGIFPAPRAIREDIPRPLASICLRAMATSPQDRYESAQDLADDVERFLADEPVMAHPDPLSIRARRWMRKHPKSVAAMAATLLVGLSSTLVISAVVSGKNRQLASVNTHLDSANVQLTVKNTQLEAATHAERQAKEAVQELAADLLVNEVDQLRIARPVGWTWKGLGNVRHAIKLRGIDRCDLYRLRSQAAACLAAADLHDVARLVKGKNIYCVKFSPDSRYLAMAEMRTKAYFADCGIWIYDLQTKQTKTLWFPMAVIRDRFQLLPDGSRALAFSPKGRWLVAGTRSGWIFRWDLTETEPHRVGWKAQPKSVDSLAFSPDGTSCYSQSSDATLVRWDVQHDWKEVARYTSETGTLFDTFIVWPDGSRIVCNNGQQLRRLDPLTLKVTKKHTVHANRWIQLVGNGPFLAIASDRSIIVFDEENGRIVEHSRIAEPSFEKSNNWHTGPLDVSPNGLYAVTGGGEHKIRLWDLANGRIASTATLGGLGDYAPVFSPDGRYIASNGPDYVVLYEARCGQCLSSAAFQPFPVEGIALSHDQDQMACIAGDRDAGKFALSVWSSDGKKRLADWTLPEGRFASTRPPIRLAVDFHPGKSELLFSMASGVAGICNPSLQTVPRFIDQVRGTHLAFSPDGETIWGIVDETKVVQWDSSDFTVLAQWDNSFAVALTGYSAVMDVTPGNRFVLIASDTGFATLLDSATAKMVYSWKSAAGPVSAVTLSRDERLSAFGTENGQLYVARIADKKLLCDEKAHRDRITALAIAPDGTWLASGARDGTIVLWQQHGDTYHPFVTLSEHAALIKQLAFTQDGDSLAVVVQGELGVRLWQLRTLHDALTELGLGLPK